MIKKVITLLLISASQFIHAQNVNIRITEKLIQVLSRINGDNTNIASLFSENFNKLVGKEELEQILADLHITVGKCSVFAKTASLEPAPASYLLQCERGIVPIDITIEKKDPYLITGFFIKTIYTELSPKISLPIVFYGLFDFDEVNVALSLNSCRLPNQGQVKEWYEKVPLSKITSIQGVYWLQPRNKHFGYQDYMHLPSLQTVDYGSNVFSAKLLMICDVNFPT